MIELAANRYGKSRVRLVKVTRNAHANDLAEWTVQVLLTGDFDSAHTDGDNSKILPTDTMKNTVYSLARISRSTAMEDFAKELADHFLTHNPQVASVAIQIESTLWRRLTVDNHPHPDTFMRGSNERQTTTVELAGRAQNRDQPGTFQIHSGLTDLVLLKTAHSAFEGYIKDPLTTLKETNDRLFGTAVKAAWHYTSDTLNFDATRKTIRETMLRAFAAHDSKSVQHTLYAMGEAALEAVPEIDDIELIMPNKHCLLVDLARFNQDNPNQIFVPTDEPHGTIEARLRRAP